MAPKSDPTTETLWFQKSVPFHISSITPKIQPKPQKFCGPLLLYPSLRNSVAPKIQPRPQKFCGPLLLPKPQKFCGSKNPTQATEILWSPAPTQASEILWLQKSNPGHRNSVAWVSFNTKLGLHTTYYSRTSLFSTRLIRSPRYFDVKLNPFCFTVI